MATIRQLVDAFVYPHIDFYADLIDREGQDVVYEGVKLLADRGNFIAETLAETTIKLYIKQEKEGNPKAAHTLELVNRYLGYATEEGAVVNTWGKLALLRGFDVLRAAHLEDRVDSALTLRVRELTNYEDFFDKKTCKLIHKPTNYYQVAMICAGLREKLGWENEGWSGKIAQILLDIMKTGSTAGFMDECPPHGRFDRYSLMITSELSDNLERIGCPMPAFALENLRRSAESVLVAANRGGDGFCYGRSLSCHGDGGSEELLASALARGLIKEEEKPLALAYSVRLLEHVLDYWYDKARHSFNIWFDGRATNGYRGVFRLLEVNLDMANHLFQTLHNFELAGLADTEPDMSVIPAPEKWVATPLVYVDEPGRKLAAITLRYRDTLAMIPFIGAGNLASHSAYLPFPAINRQVETAPESGYPFLTPEYHTADGKRLRPVEFFTSVDTENTATGAQITVTGFLSEVSGLYPQKTEHPFRAKFSFAGNEITACFNAEVECETVEMMIGTHGDGTVIAPVGFETKEPVACVGDPAYFTPHGPITEAALAMRSKNAEVGYRITL